MKTVVKIEELALILLSLYLFTTLGYAWWWFPVLLFVPDVSMVGYLFGTTVGAWVYNVAHHRATAIVFFLLGVSLQLPVLQLVGVIMLAHTSLDRLLGYGLKHTDSFQHTHLGWIGNAKE